MNCFKGAAVLTESKEQSYYQNSYQVRHRVFATEAPPVLAGFS